MKSHKNYINEELNSFSSDNVANLQVLLNQEMVGIQRMPALLFYAPHKSLIELNLGDYEFLNNEPSHDILHHTQNIYNELPYHLPKKCKLCLKRLKVYHLMAKKQRMDQIIERA